MMDAIAVAAESVAAAAAEPFLVEDQAYPPPPWSDDDEQEAMEPSPLTFEAAASTDMSPPADNPVPVDAPSLERIFRSAVKGDLSLKS